MPNFYSPIEVNNSLTKLVLLVFSPLLIRVKNKGAITSNRLVLAFDIEGLTIAN